MEKQKKKRERWALTKELYGRKTSKNFYVTEA